MYFRLQQTLDSVYKYKLGSTRGSRVPFEPIGSGEFVALSGRPGGLGSGQGRRRRNRTTKKDQRTRVKGTRIIVSGSSEGSKWLVLRIFFLSCRFWKRCFTFHSRINFLLPCSFFQDGFHLVSDASVMICSLRWDFMARILMSWNLMLWSRYILYSGMIDFFG